MVSILVTEPEYFDRETIDVLKSVGTVTARRLAKEELVKEIENVDILVCRIETQVDKAVLDAAKKLKIIGSATTGLNHIDLEYAKQKGVQIINLSGTHTTSTAEYTFSLILALSKRIPWAFENLSNGIWERHKFFGHTLHGKTLGVIGYGKIGRQVASYAKALGMNIIAFDPYVKSADIRLVSLEDLLKESDVITIHAMLTKETENLIGEQQFKLMKESAIIVNAARGQIVNSEALINALKEKLILGAAQDVFVQEPLSPTDSLIKFAKENSNLLITPHIAATTYEAAHEAGLEIATKVKEELSK
ncbi:MAG TPA: hydroxyacid dehydrogenase [archaeon]|nr:hydroxyacid dehydrogenase [archaeon]